MKEKKSETKAAVDLLDLDGIEEPVITEQEDPEPQKQSILDSIFDQIDRPADGEKVQGMGEGLGVNAGWESDMK